MNAKLSFRTVRSLLLAALTAGALLLVAAAPRSAEACGDYGPPMTKEQVTLRKRAIEGLANQKVVASVGVPVIDGNRAHVLVRVKTGKDSWSTRSVGFSRSCSRSSWELSGISQA